MDIIQLVEQMSDDMYQRLKCAAETGKWPDGTKVSEEQKASSLQVVMAYQAKRLNSDQMLTVGPDGHLVSKTKAELKQQFSSASNSSANENDIVRFSNL